MAGVYSLDVERVRRRERAARLAEFLRDRDRGVAEGEPTGRGLDALQPADRPDLRLADRAVAAAVQMVDRLAGRVVALAVGAYLCPAGPDLEGLRSLRRAAAGRDRLGCGAG